MYITEGRVEETGRSVIPSVFLAELECPAIGWKELSFRKHVPFYLLTIPGRGRVLRFIFLICQMWFLSSS